MSEKRELIDIAGQLQSIVDRLLECAKEDKDDEDEEDEGKKESLSSPRMIATMLKNKLK